jgi:2-keto-4-pentenoate hydratase/2-oxohepta-3-ene-1,7-dioic acid hydratase in catechol pathway
VRLVRIEQDGRAVPGDLVSDTIHLLDAHPLDAEQSERTGETLALGDARLLAPVVPSKIFGIGRNYAAHVEELKVEPATSLSVFLKAPSSVVGHGEAVVLPPDEVSTHVEHEAELAVVIGRPARGISPSEALDYVFGYTCANDVSARDVQKADIHVTRGKGFDTFCPVGPWVVTDLTDPSNLAVRCHVNGETVQDGRTEQMIFDIPTIISNLSQWATLLPGDLILTGSPGGTTRLGRGDVVTVDVEGVGVLSNPVV